MLFKCTQDSCTQFHFLPAQHVPCGPFYSAPSSDIYAIMRAEHLCSMLHGECQLYLCLVPFDVYNAMFLPPSGYYIWLVCLVGECDVHQIPLPRELVEQETVGGGI